MRIGGIVAAVVAALAFVSSAPAPVWAQAPNFLRIDESVEGALPTITESPAISGLVTTSVVPVAGVVGEEWAVSISFVATGDTTINSPRVGLREPDSLSLSDALIASSLIVIDNMITINYNLFSDDNLGQIGTNCDTCQTVLTEDGTFQLMPGNFFTTGNIAETDIFLKSDVDVPEPSSAGLLLGALGALLALGAWYRRAA